MWRRSVSGLPTDAMWEVTYAGWGSSMWPHRGPFVVCMWFVCGNFDVFPNFFYYLCFSIFLIKKSVCIYYVSIHIVTELPFCYIWILCGSARVVLARVVLARGVLARVVLACVVLAYVVTTQCVSTCCVCTCCVLARVVLARVVLARVVLACVVLAYVVTRHCVGTCCVGTCCGGTCCVSMCS